VDELMERCKAGVRAKVEHVFFYAKRMFVYQKVSYRGLAKNKKLPGTAGWICQLDASQGCSGLMLMGLL